MNDKFICTKCFLEQKGKDLAFSFHNGNVQICKDCVLKKAVEIEDNRIKTVVKYFEENESC